MGERFRRKGEAMTFKDWLEKVYLAAVAKGYSRQELNDAQIDYIDGSWRSTSDREVCVIINKISKKLHVGIT